MSACVAKIKVGDLVRVVKPAGRILQEGEVGIVSDIIEHDFLPIIEVDGYYWDIDRFEKVDNVFCVTKTGS